MPNRKVRIVDMCIYIDNNIYGDFDEEKVYIYLKHIFYSLAKKKNFFKTYEDYANYASYAAAQTYMRLINKKQFLDDNDPRKLEKIKSILNFVKRVLYPLKVNYQKSSFNDVIKSEEQVEYDGESIHSAIKNYLTDIVRSNSNNLISVDINSYISTINRTIMGVVDQTPYCNDNVMKKRLYKSCLITLLRNFTLSNYNKSKLFILNKYPRKLEDKYLSEIYSEESYTAPLCWRLGDEFLPYIQALCVRCKKLICDDIRYLMHNYDLSDDQISDILMNPLSEISEER